MKKYTYIYFDPSSFHNWKMIETKLSLNKSFEKIDERYYRMHLLETEFLHAMLLMGAFSRFDQDLRAFLSTVTYNFSSLSSIGTAISLSRTSTSDHKRRMSEDLGIAIGSLFMTKIFDIDWHKISQIPTSTSLTKKKPDFIAYNKGNDCFIFECKGTTALENFKRSTEKASEQVKTYAHTAVNKIGIISFIPTEPHDPMPFTYIFDPLSNIPFEINEDLSEELHFENILKYLGMEKQAKSYLKQLSNKIRAEEKEILELAKMPMRYQSLNNYEYILKKMHTRIIDDKVFYGRQVRIESTNKTFFLGYDPTFSSDEISSYSNDQYSIFNDGTILIIE